MSVSKQSVLARRSRRERTISIVLACLVVTGIAVVSFLPGDGKEVLHTRGRFHSWGHLIAFGIVAFPLARLARSTRARLLLFAAALIFGFGIEFAEHAIYHSVLEWKDILVDAIGVTCGTLMALVTAPREAS
ncbi:hypothetical protein [Acidicapsa ligni]|uniref:hypothetical protein n=1 Tax=Acidicapsa ligni TaxID=542300 RepID=UPI0021DF6467|nr:hypothetical protein [Acidicapsa ligni]